MERTLGSSHTRVRLTIILRRLLHGLRHLLLLLRVVFIQHLDIVLSQKGSSHLVIFKFFLLLTESCHQLALEATTTFGSHPNL